MTDTERVLRLVRAGLDRNEPDTDSLLEVLEWLVHKEQDSLPSDVGELIRRAVRD